MKQRRALNLTVLATVVTLALLVPGENVGSHVPITTRITFNREVVRILRKHCLECHSPRGIRSDQPLLTYAEARPWAKAIKEEVLNRRMSPYQAVPGYGHFRESYHLTPRDLELLVSWIEGGVPRGDDKDYPAGLVAELNGPRAWSGGEPDLILQPRSESQVAAAPFTGRRCFNLPVGNPGPLQIRQVEFMPDAGQVVFSAAIHLAPAGRRDGCGQPEKSLAPLAEWVPGQRSFPAPPGMARILPPHARLVLTINYRGSAEPTRDRSRVGLYFAPAPVAKAVETINIRHTTKPAERRTVVDYHISTDREILAIRPLLKPNEAREGSFEARLTRPDGSSEVLVFVRDYRFDWQPSYHFQIPRPAPRGSVISITTYTSLPPPPTICQIVTARSI